LDGRQRLFHRAVLAGDLKGGRAADGHCQPFPGAALIFHQGDANRHEVPVHGSQQASTARTFM